jgi:tagatose-1,6-bisphosphate aldolase
MDLLKLEWPGSAEACAEVTKNLGTVPWVLLSAGVAYDAFVERTTIALDNGACGFIAGRAIWGEAVALQGAERRAWLADVAAPRLRGLGRVLEQRGRSWRAAGIGGVHPETTVDARDG